jgi:hypothetical protein
MAKQREGVIQGSLKGFGRALTTGLNAAQKAANSPAGKAASARSNAGKAVANTVKVSSNAAKAPARPAPKPPKPQPQLRQGSAPARSVTNASGTGKVRVPSGGLGGRNASIGAPKEHPQRAMERYAENAIGAGGVANVARGVAGGARAARSLVPARPPAPVRTAPKPPAPRASAPKPPARPATPSGPPRMTPAQVAARSPHTPEQSRGIMAEAKMRQAMGDINDGIISGMSFKQRLPIASQRAIAFRSKMPGYAGEPMPAPAATRKIGEASKPKETQMTARQRIAAEDAARRNKPAAKPETGTIDFGTRTPTPKPPATSRPRTFNQVPYDPASQATPSRSGGAGKPSGNPRSVNKGTDNTGKPTRAGYAGKPSDKPRDPNTGKPVKVEKPKPPVNIDAYGDRQKLNPKGKELYPNTPSGPFLPKGRLEKGPSWKQSEDIDKFRLEGSPRSIDAYSADKKLPATKTQKVSKAEGWNRNYDISRGIAGAPQASETPRPYWPKDPFIKESGRAVNIDTHVRDRSRWQGQANKRSTADAVAKNKVTSKAEAAKESARKSKIEKMREDRLRSERYADEQEKFRKAKEKLENAPRPLKKTPAESVTKQPGRKRDTYGGRNKPSKREAGSTVQNTTYWTPDFLRDHRYGVNPPDRRF